MRDELRGEKDTYAGGGGGLGEKRDGVQKERDKCM